MGEGGLCSSVFSGTGSQGLNELEEEIEDAIVGNVADHGPTFCTP